jgi:hypothetical protein
MSLNLLFYKMGLSADIIPDDIIPNVTFSSEILNVWIRFWELA